jgi:hypothetical protein
MHPSETRFAPPYDFTLKYEPFAREKSREIDDFTAFLCLRLRFRNSFIVLPAMRMNAAKHSRPIVSIFFTDERFA